MFHLRQTNHNISESFPLNMRREQGLYEFYMFLYNISPIYLLKDNEEIYCKPGSFIIFSPYKPQIWNAVAPRFTHSYVSFTVDDPKYFENLGLPLDEPVSADMHKEISETMALLKKEAYGTGIGKDYLTDAAINMMFINISRKIHQLLEKKNDYKHTLLERFERVRLAIFEDPSHNVNYYANMASFSTRRFQQYYKLFFNAIPSSDISLARKIKAEEYLLKKEPISLAAEKTGFSCTEYFSKWFKRQTGKSYKF